MILKIFLNGLSPKHINSIVIIFLRNCTYLFFITDVSKVVGQNDNLKIKITQNNTPHFSYMHNNFFLKKSVLYLKSMPLTTEFPPAETTLAEPSGCRYIITYCIDTRFTYVKVLVNPNAGSGSKLARFDTEQNV